MGLGVESPSDKLTDMVNLVNNRTAEPELIDSVLDQV